MNPARFRNSTTGRLLRVGQGEASYWAFVPHPLPPAFTLEGESVHALSEADRALGELAGLGRAISNPHLLIGPFVRREAVLSSRIEGTQADITDLYAYEAGQLLLPGIKQPPPQSDVREVSNYVRALEYGLERVKSLPVSLRLMRELHQHLLEGVRGEQAAPGNFRRKQNWIGRPDCTLKEADFVPPPLVEMGEALDVFEKYLHSRNDYPPLVRLALIHYQFEAIHPFVDGNGRIGRLLISLLLVHWNLLPLPLLYLSAYFFRNRQSYYDLLLAVSERDAWHEWVCFFLRGVAEQAHDAISRTKRLQDLEKEWRQRLTQARASSLSLRLMEQLFDTPLVTIPQAQRMLGVTYHGARHNVQKLAEAGILRQLDEISHPKIFIAQDIVQAVWDRE